MMPDRKFNPRSVTGVLLMLGILPIFAGLLACMPEFVPLGDPEKSRVNPALNGTWFMEGGDENAAGAFFIQPWDKRTYQVATIYFEVDPDELADEYDLSVYDDAIAFLQRDDLDMEDLKIGTASYKGWLVKLGGETFMTFELRSIPHPETGSLEPWFWWDYRIDGIGDDRLPLKFVDPEYPALEEAEKTRKAWEKVVRKNVDDPDLYEEEEGVLRRVSDEHLELFAALLTAALVKEF